MGLAGATDWLAVVDQTPDEPVWVRVVGGVCGDRADDLWSTLEMALEDAAGRMVVVDLARVSGFDLGSIEAVKSVARSVKRWHVAMCAVVAPASAVSDYLLAYSVDRLIPLYRSAQAVTDAAEDDQTSQMLIASYLWARDRMASPGRPVPATATLTGPAVA